MSIVTSKCNFDPRRNLSVKFNEIIICTAGSLSSMFILTEGSVYTQMLRWQWKGIFFDVGSVRVYIRPTSVIDVEAIGVIIPYLFVYGFYQLGRAHFVQAI